MKRKILLLVDDVNKNSASISDHVDSFFLYSENQVSRLNVVGLTSALDLYFSQFDVLIIHFNLVISDPAYISAQVRYSIKNFKGLKVLFIQDEYRWIFRTLSCIEALSINLLMSCVPLPDREKIYPASRFSHLEVVTVLTGYVPERLLHYSLPSYDERLLDVGYRTRKIYYWLGRLGLEKNIIMDKFLPLASQYALKVDLSYHDQDRLFGEDWINFLRNSKASLGVESGSSLCDFSGEIQKRVEEHQMNHPNDSFEEVESIFFPNLDGQVKIQVISPRVFECAALKNLMIFFEGYYSGVLEPWRHYVPLKKDFSNMDEVVRILKSEDDWKRITDQAYQEIALNPKYHYRQFIQDLDSKIEQHLNSGAFTLATAAAAPIMLSSGKPKINFSQMKRLGIDYLIRVLISVLNRLGYSPRQVDRFLDRIKKKYYTFKKKLIYSKKKKIVESIDYYQKTYQKKSCSKGFFCLCENSFSMSIIEIHGEKVCERCRWFLLE